MKKYFIGCLLLILFNSVSAQIVIDSSKSNFDIKYNRVARLTNAIGKVAAVKKGTINNVIKNDVVLLSLKNAGEVAATDFAGIFFDAIPDPFL